MQSRLFYLFFAGLGCALTNSTAAQVDAGTVSAVISPAFLTSGRFGVQAGASYALSDRWTVLGELAAPVGKNRSGREKEKFFRINTEIQRVLRLSTPNRYLAFQAGYVFRSFKATSGGMFTQSPGDTSGFSYTDAAINSPVLTNTLKIGRKLYLGERLFFDLFVGMGVRVIFTRYNANNLVPTPLSQRVDKIFPAPDPAWECNCTVARFNPAGGVRVGFSF
jgi:hypothetical protein